MRTNRISGSLAAMLGIVCLLVGCSDNDKFTIKGTVDDGGSMNIYIKYYGDNAVTTTMALTRDGAFEISGASDYPTMVEIQDVQRNVLGTLYVANGDKISVELDRANPYNIQVSGSDINSRWARVLNANADTLLHGSARSINDIVEGYISEHPDDVVSTLLFATFYDSKIDPWHADSVVMGISETGLLPGILSSYRMVSHRYARAEAREKLHRLTYRTAENDSARMFDVTDKPMSLLVFSDDIALQHDSIVPALRRVYKAADRKKLQIINYYLPSDTVTFKNAGLRDTVQWITAWTPGGIYGIDIDRLAIPSMPYYVVADSAGTQLYRGMDIDQALDVISLRLSD